MAESEQNGGAAAKSKASAAPSEAVAFFDVVGSDQVFDEGGEKATSDVVRMQPVQAAGDYPESGAGLVFPAGVYELHLGRGRAKALPAGTRLALRLPLAVVSVADEAGDEDDGGDADADAGDGGGS